MRCLPLYVLAVCSALTLVPLAGIANAQTGNVENGRQLYSALCVECHGTNPTPRQSGSSPNLGVPDPVLIRDAINSQGRMNFLSFLTDTDLADIAAWFAALLMPQTATQPVYTGAWASPGESGWGLSIIKSDTTNAQGVIMYTYDAGRQPAWYFMVGSWTSDTVFAGPLLRFTGPAFGEMFNQSLVASSPAGNMSLTFTSATTAMVTYSIGSTTISNKALQRIQF